VSLALENYRWHAYRETSVMGDQVDMESDGGACGVLAGVARVVAVLYVHRYGLVVNVSCRELCAERT
jgi:hypothetical protein